MPIPLNQYRLHTMEIFVFGSNLAGRHGAGAAKTAMDKYGAVYGVGVGQAGASYAIPTKDRLIRTLPLDSIRTFVREFIEFAYLHKEVTFKVTAIGCGLAGYTPAEIAPMFVYAPRNCVLPQRFVEILKTNHQTWDS